MASLVAADQSQLPRITPNEVKSLLLLIRVQRTRMQCRISLHCSSAGLVSGPDPLELSSRTSCGLFVFLNQVFIFSFFLYVISYIFVQKSKFSTKAKTQRRRDEDKLEKLGGKNANLLAS